MFDTLTRRSFLKSTAIAGGGLVLSGTFRLLAAEGPKAAELNAWVRVGADDIVTIIVSQTEIGQGITTTLPAALVDELGADWSRVRFETAPVAVAYQNPERHWQFTGNSESTSSFIALMQKMGAGAREMLVSAAAERWGVSPDSLKVEKGVITNPATGKKLRFGEVAADAAKRTPPENPKIKSPSEWTLIGKPLPRVDIPGKIDGAARFGIDYFMPGLLHASIKRIPTVGGSVKSFNAAAVKSMPGVIDVIALPNGVAVVAEKYWQARKAADALPIEFDDGPNTSVDSKSLEEKYRAALDSPGWNRVTGSADIAGDKTITREYQSQFLAHATMEPMNCTARVANGEVDVWAPTQGPELTQVTLAAILGIPREKIRIHILLAGGGFGRRLLPDFAIDAALLSRAAGGRPVKVIWSREEDIQHDHYRPATLHRITASLDASGAPSAVRHQLVSPTILFPVFPPLAGSPVDPSCCEGLTETRYRIPGWALDFKLLKLPLQTSVLRTTGYGPNIFAWESFIDELAHDAGKDPYEFRRALLADGKRAIALLDLVAEKSDWGKPGNPKGIAFTDAFGSLLAQVVELSVSPDRQVHIHRVTSALDAGRVLDRGIATSNIQGGVIWGLSAAFKSEISFRDGRSAQSNYHDFQIVRMNEIPDRIDVHFIDSGAKIGGVGEIGPVTIPPAVANAIFAATGERIRSLPLSRHGFTLA